MDIDDVGPLFVCVSFLFLIGAHVRHDASLRCVRAFSIVSAVGAVVLFLCSSHPATAFNDMGTQLEGSRACGWSDGAASKRGDPWPALTLYLEGMLGALVMALSFIGALAAAVDGVVRKSRRSYLFAASLLIVAIGAFISRSMMSTFKPVIYLYPTETTDVHVALHYEGRLTVTYPAYDPAIAGWRVTATPSGKLVNKSDGREYSYLFWEGTLARDVYVMPAEGFVVRGEDSAVFLQDLLARAGLTPAEYNEFIVYWYPHVKEYPYVQIAFAGPEYERSARLDISPKPDSILRVFLYFKRLNSPRELRPQVIPQFIRRGFTVIEWGGTILP